VTASGTLLEVARSGAKPPLRFVFQELSFRSVNAETGLSYHFAMHNPEPPGEIRSSGNVGPFDLAKFGETPLSGTYSLDRADLSVFDGIAGSLSSKGSFSGSLGGLNVQGTTEIPGFEVLRSGHAGDLRAQFSARVDARNGDVSLKGVKVSYGETQILADGSVAKTKGWKGKFTSLDFTVRDGRIEDIVRMLAKGHSHQSPIAGTTSFQAHVTVPPEGKPFLREVILDGDFDIRNGHFEHPRTQTRVDTFSEKARGQKKGDAHKDIQEEDPPENVASQLGGWRFVAESPGLQMCPSRFLVRPPKHKGLSMCSTRKSIFTVPSRLTPTLLSRPVESNPSSPKSWILFLRRSTGRSSQ